MGSTTTGLPWPDPAAPVRNGAADIRTLADSTEKRWGADEGRWPRRVHRPNAQGGSASRLLFTVLGAVGITEALGYSCIRPDGAPAGTLWINVFSTSNGLAAANAFIILHYIAFGS